MAEENRGEIHVEMDIQNWINRIEFGWLAGIPFSELFNECNASEERGIISTEVKILYITMLASFYKKADDREAKECL